tara:strand:+ start:412 stop:1233 length:822 start_codon:yes stop_codon:yes gene_type:complete
MKAKRNELLKLMALTKRDCFVADKKQAQVKSCIVDKIGNKISTTSLVRDGKTSVAHFQFKNHDSSFKGEQFIIPDIDTFVGIVREHGETITIKQKDNKLRITSKTANGKVKTTTLKANENALAFPHTQETVKGWNAKSKERAEQISRDGYTTLDGETINPFVEIRVATTDLLEALSSGSVNGQKLGRCELILNEWGLVAKAGDELKGRTTTELCEVDGKEFNVVIEGGLSFVLNKVENEYVVLSFFDFSQWGQGIRVLFSFGDSWVFQAGVVT